jgi:RNA recognition motif-containing protein
MSYSILYIGGIPGNFSEGDVLAYFQQFTPSAKFTMIASSTRASNSSQFGYLTVASDVILNIRSYQHYLDGNKIICEEYMGDENTSNLRNSLKRRRIFIRNIKKSISDQDLHTAFSRFGPVESAFIIKDHLTGKSRSFGYITFIDEEPAFALVTQAHIMIKGIRIFIHAFDKNMEDTLRFIQKKAVNNIQQQSSSDSNSAMNYSEEDWRQQDTTWAGGQPGSPKRVQFGNLHSKKISPSRPSGKNHLGQSNLLSPQLFFNVRSSNSKAAQGNHPLYRRTSHSPQSLFWESTNQEGNSNSPDASASSGNPSQFHTASIHTLHLKPTSKRYHHAAVLRISGSGNLRFNRLCSPGRPDYYRRF